MKRLTLLLLLISPFLLVGSMNTAAQHPDRLVVSYRITDAPFFFDGPAGVCAFTGTVAVENLSGDPIGTTTLCVKRPEERPGPPYQFIEHGRLSVDLPDGHLEFKVTFTDTYNADQTAAAHDATRGTLRKATGRFEGASGTLTGSGVILFAPDGTFQPFLTYHARLRTRSA